MRARHSLISLLLATAIVAGQWLAAVHAPDHALQPGAAHACAVCVYAHGAGSGVLPAMPVLRLAPATEAPATQSVASPLAVVAGHHPIRGPPALLA